MPTWVTEMQTFGYRECRQPWEFDFTRFLRRMEGTLKGHQIRHSLTTRYTDTRVLFATTHGIKLYMAPAVNSERQNP